MWDRICGTNMISFLRLAPYRNYPFVSSFLDWTVTSHCPCLNTPTKSPFLDGVGCPSRVAGAVHNTGRALHTWMCLSLCCTVRDCDSFGRDCSDTEVTHARSFEKSYPADRCSVGVTLLSPGSAKSSRSHSATETLGLVVQPEDIPDCVAVHPRCFHAPFLGWGEAFAKCIALSLRLTLRLPKTKPQFRIKEHCEPMYRLQWSGEQTKHKLDASYTGRLIREQTF